MHNIEAVGHVTGRSLFLDDLPQREGTLHAVPLGSPVAHGRLRKLDLAAAEALPGVRHIFTWQDIPGENQVGDLIADEPLLAEKELHYRGQPIALIVAADVATARAARRLIRVETEALPVVTDPREAMRKGQLLFPPRTFRLGDTDRAWPRCAHIFTGRVESGGQEHLYLETQGAYVYPLENGSLKVHSATQGPTAVQRAIARILGLPMHRVEVEVTRLGGAFGGKEDQATPWAAMAALASFHLDRPVKMVLQREDDIRMTGKRHPYSSDFRIGLTEEGKILALDVTYYQNGGAAADLSPAILERTLFHTTNSYFIPHVTATAFSCRTNLPPNTAFRGFGAPQAVFVIESAIARAADELGVPARVLQEKNLLREKDGFPYGQIATQVKAGAAWRTALHAFAVEAEANAVAAFNQKHLLVKKGMALQPICFGISFTKTSMNQAHVLVHIYQDGSVGVSTGAVEMGQGVNTKLTQVAALTLSVDPRRIRLESTDTTRVANTSPTAASTGTDLNGKALQTACVRLRQRLLQTAAHRLDCPPASLELHDEWVWKGAQRTDLHWEPLVQAAFLEREQLSEVAHYATPAIYFDKEVEKGHPFAYHVYGTALVTATVDCLRGIYRIDAVKIIHDFGQSLNPEIDRGQIEGGLLQGIGWMTMEEVLYDREGRLLSDSLSAYKVPDIYAAPGEVDCRALDTTGPPTAILRSKAIGEPPFLYGIGAYFALQQAIRAFNPDYSLTFDAPFTPEKVLKALYQKHPLAAGIPTA